MERMRDYAKRLGVCKKTALAHARRSGLHVEKRHVRGGWAWFVDYTQSDAESIAFDTARLQRCIDIAMAALRRGLPERAAAELAVDLYIRSVS